jgi:hypothetical protein
MHLVVDDDSPVLKSCLPVEHLRYINLERTMLTKPLIVGTQTEMVDVVVTDVAGGLF